MPALNPQDIIAEGKCYACYGMSLSDLIKLTLISNIDASEEPDEFDPADVAGLTVWLDAMTLPVVADGTQIQNWPDVSGNANHFSQAVLLNRPRYFSAGAVLSLPAVRFNGSNGFMDTTTLASAMMTTTAFTIFAVASVAAFSTAAPPSLPWNNQTLLGTTGGYQGIVFTSNGPEVWAWAYDGGAETAQAVGSPGAHTYQSRLDAGRIYMRQDSGVEVSVVCGPVGSLANTMRIGSNYLGTTFYAGDFMELLIYNNVVSGADRILILAYLSAKWFA